MPWRAPQELPAFIKSAAALLVILADDPVFAQTIPSKLQSCLASGRPIVASLMGESARIVEEAQCGLACPPQDPAALADAARAIATMPQTERDRLGRNAHAYFQAHFTQSRIIAMVLERLCALAEPKP